MRRSSLLVGAVFLAAAVLPLNKAGAQDSAGNPDYDNRLQRLEEQIVDLNAQLGTVQTLSQSGAGAPPPGDVSGGGSFAGGGDDGGRVSEIETQVRALSAQMGEMLRRLERIEQRSGGLAPGRQQGGPASDEPTEQGTGFSVGGDDRRSRDDDRQSRDDGRQSGGGFGATIEPRPDNSAGRDNSGDYLGDSYFGGAPGGDAPGGGGTALGGGPAPGSDALGGATAPVRTAANSSPQARAMYDQAYNALVQRNYRAAVDGFEQFVQAHSSDPLAGSAYFWLGEASFISGEYRKAADSFLRSSTNYPQNDKAAESLLKLGISLKRLGENKAACSSFAELTRRFPSATPVLQRAEREKSRSQC